MNKDLVITAPRQGIAQSPHVGYGDVRQLDIFTSPGVAKLNNLVTKVSGSTVTARVNWMVKNPATPAEVYALSTAGVVYKSTNSGATWVAMTGNTQTSCHGNGLAIWKNYLFVARDAFLDVCGDGTATGITNANWTNSWKAIDSDVLWHPMLVSKNDNKLYGGAGKYVFSLDEVSGQTFLPATAGTYTYTQQALDLPPNYRIKCIEELGNNLMLGTWMGTNVYDLRVADIFPWDRSSSSFGQPIAFNEFGVHAMLNTGNSLIVLAGIDGQVFVSDGVNATPVAQIPSSISNLQEGKWLDFFPGAICNWKKRVYFGVSTGGFNTAIAGVGVYSLTRTSQGNILVLEHLLSTGIDGSGTNDSAVIGALLPVTRDNLLIGWNSETPSSEYGIDNITVTSYTTGYGGYFDTPLYTIGTHDHTREFQEVEIQLARPLRANEGVRIAYRDDLGDSFTTLLTWDFATYGAGISHNTVLHRPTFNLPAAEQLQLRISLTGNLTTPELKSVTLR